MPESAEYFDNITVGQYAMTGVPLKVYVNGTYYTITAPEDVDDPLIGYGMKPNGVMEPFNYREIEHINVSGNIVDIETYKKAMDDESKAAVKAKEESGDEEKDAESGDEEKDSGGDDEKEGGDEKEDAKDSGNPFESFKRKGKLLNEKRGFTSRGIRMKAIGVLNSLGIKYPSESQIKDVIRKVLAIIKDQNLGTVFEITKDVKKAREKALDAEEKALKDKRKELDDEPITDGILKEGPYDNISIKDLHFEIDPKKFEAMKLALGARLGGITSREKIENADYELKRFRKQIQYGDGNNLEPFKVDSYESLTSKLVNGPHAKKRAPERWTQKKYDQWIEDVASEGGADNAYDMARNASKELQQWVKRNLVYDETPLERIQWDIESLAEGVISESVISDILIIAMESTTYEKFIAELIKQKFLKREDLRDQELADELKTMYRGQALGKRESVNESLEDGYMLNRLADNQLGNEPASEFLLKHNIDLKALAKAKMQGVITAYEIRDIVKGKAPQSTIKKFMKDYVVESVNEELEAPYEYDNISEPYSIKVGDMVKNTNPSCKHFGSQGVVKQIIDMPNDIGQLIKYIVMNQGSTFKPGTVLTKTFDQLEPMK